MVPRGLKNRFVKRAHLGASSFRGASWGRFVRIQGYASDIVVDEGVVGESMAKAVWNGKVLAESEKTQLVEGNVYFPHDSIDREFFRSSSTISTCPWKGQARYYTILVDGQENSDAAWYYPDPKPAARAIKNHVAFWRGVEIEK
jgi:uncharacterized protein (DUF427 family)